MGFFGSFGKGKEEQASNNGEINKNISSKQDNFVNLNKKNNKEEKVEENYNVSNIIEDKTKKEINKLLTSSDLDKVKYLFLELSQLYFGTIPNVEISGDDTIKFIFEGFTFKKSIEAIYLDIIKNFQDKTDIKCNYSGLKFKNYNFDLSINDYKCFYTIKISGHLNDKKILFLKGLIEQYLLDKNFLEKGTDFISIAEIKNDLKDIKSININLGSDNINILFKNKLNEDIFSKIFSKVLNKNRNYYIWDEGTILIQNINILYKSYSEIIDTKLSKGFDKDGSLYISLPTKINSKFWIDIVYPLIEELSKYKEEENETDIIDILKNIGTVVELPNEDKVNFQDILNKKGFVGYEDILEKIETNIILPWKDKESYIKKAKEISPKLVKDILPNAVLFYGVPGTGKTTISSAIGEYLNYPFVYLPVQKIMSKWYGESETKLDIIFENVGKLGKKYGGVVFMIDEIDEIGKNREKTHEATAKLTGILLKKLDGLEKLDNLLLIGATNLKDSLDDALLSRFSENLEFRLPNKEEIIEIFKFYIPGIEINNEVLDKLDGISGRDIKNMSKQIAKLAIKENKNINDITSSFFESYKI